MSLKSHARLLRKTLTIAETKLWHHLRCRQIAGYKFRRQIPIGNYIVDFLCYETRIIVEVDGGQHNENFEDEKRTQWLITQEFRVLRFWNNEVLFNINGVKEVILSACLNRPHPNLPPQGGEEH